MPVSTEDARNLSKLRCNQCEAVLGQAGDVDLNMDSSSATTVAVIERGTFRAVHVLIAQERRLPAPERVTRIFEAAVRGEWHPVGVEVRASQLRLHD